MGKPNNIQRIFVSKHTEWPKHGMVVCVEFSTIEVGTTYPC